jgi:hypothetical protein
MDGGGGGVLWPFEQELQVHEKKSLTIAILRESTPPFSAKMAGESQK